MSENILLRNVRISYPRLFEFEKFEGVDTDKYACTFLIPKSDTATVKKVKFAFDAAVKKAGLKKLPAGAKLCLKDGDESEDENFHGHYTLKATNRKRFTIKPGKNEPNVTHDDGTFYAGCYVNAILSGDFYCYTNYSKGVTSQLLGIQFFKDGEPLAASRAASDSDFEAFDDMDFPEDTSLEDDIASL